MNNLDITIFLKNGTQFSFFASKLTLKKNGLGEFVGFEWVNTEQEEMRRLLYVDANEIAAITSSHTMSNMER